MCIDSDWSCSMTYFASNSYSYIKYIAAAVLYVPDHYDYSECYHKYHHPFPPPTKD